MTTKLNESGPLLRGAHLFTILLLGTASAVCGADLRTVNIRFAAKVNGKDLVCGTSYEGIGTTKSRISPKDFRFYVHNLRLVDMAGVEYPLELAQDSKWQLDNVVLLDFENGTGPCANGNPDLNMQVTGSVPAGKAYRGLRFTLGVPFQKNHTDLTAMPSPLNLTALAWVWNAGRKFARLDFASTGLPRGFALHLGSTGCTPHETKLTIPTLCEQPNRPEIELTSFDWTRDVVVADLGDLLADSNVDQNVPNTPAGCMSGQDDPDCGPIFANLGLGFPGMKKKAQTFFHAAPSDNQATKAYQ